MQVKSPSIVKPLILESMAAAYCYVLLNRLLWFPLYAAFYTFPMGRIELLFLGRVGLTTGEWKTVHFLAYCALLFLNAAKWWMVEWLKMRGWVKLAYAMAITLVVLLLIAFPLRYMQID